jgi:hypothetical protein
MLRVALFFTTMQQGLIPTLHKQEGSVRVGTFEWQDLGKSL